MRKIQQIIIKLGIKFYFPKSSFLHNNYKLFKRGCFKSNNCEKDLFSIACKCIRFRPKEEELRIFVIYVCYLMLYITSGRKKTSCNKTDSVSYWRSVYSNCITWDALYQSNFAPRKFNFRSRLISICLFTHFQLVPFPV